MICHICNKSLRIDGTNPSCVSQDHEYTYCYPIEVIRLIDYQCYISIYHNYTTIKFTNNFFHFKHKMTVIESIEKAKTLITFQ